MAHAPSPKKISSCLGSQYEHISEALLEIRSASWSCPITVNFTSKILSFSWVKLKRFSFDVLFLLYFGCEHVNCDSIPLINNYMWLIALPWGWFHRNQFLFGIRIILLWYLTILTFFRYRMAAILEFCIKMKSKRQIYIWFGILVIEFIEKMYLCKVIGVLVQNLIFQNGVIYIFIYIIYIYIIRLFNIGQNADALQKKICYNTRMQINKWINEWMFRRIIDYVRYQCKSLSRNY